MTKTYDVIIFGPHPDDVEFGMGGTAIKLCRAGQKVLSVCLTRGEMGTYGDVATRELEFKEACKRIGMDGVMLDFKDTGVENSREARLILAKIIREHKPKIVFAPYHTNPIADFGGVSNVDHYTTGQLVRDAVKMARLEKTVPSVPKHTISKLYFYMLPRNVWPSLMVDVSDVIDLWQEALKAYKTQLSINFIGNDVVEILLAKRRSNGIELGTKYAEGFVTETPLRMTAERFFEC